MSTKREDNIDKVARNIRKGVREKCGLKEDWKKASIGMKFWYKMLAARLMIRSTSVQ